MDRIRKLHALATRNSNTHEAASAAAKVQALCMEYELELDTILASEPQTKAEPYEKADYLMPDTHRNNVGWKRSLFASIASAHFCKAIYYSGTCKMGVIGQRHNFEVVCYLFDYLTREIDRLGHAAWKESGYLGNKGRAKFLLAFAEGAGIEIGRRLNAAMQEQAQSTVQCTALIVRKDQALSTAVKSHWPRLRSVGRTRHTGDGYSQGRQAGQSIPLQSGIGSRSTGQLTH